MLQVTKKVYMVWRGRRWRGRGRGRGGGEREKGRGKGSVTCPINLVVGVISLPHDNWFLQVIKPCGFLGILPPQVQTPADLIRVVLQTSVRDAVVEKHHPSKRDFTCHYVILHVCVKNLLYLFLLHLHIPSSPSTASVGSCDATLMASRHHLHHQKGNKLGGGEQWGGQGGGVL